MKPDNDSVAGRLCEEANSALPVFSQSLHDRIMERVRNQTAPVSSAPVLYPQIRWVLVTAAVLTIIGGVVLRQTLRPPGTVSPREIVAIHRSVPIPQFAVSFPSLAAPAGSELLAARYAYLDRDASTVARFLADQINISPDSRKRQ